MQIAGRFGAENNLGIAEEWNEADGEIKIIISRYNDT
jgi:hypothetical protein